jgi:hypothetical protein
MYALVVLLMLVLAPVVSMAQPVTWHQLDIRDTDMPLLALLIQGLTPDSSLLGRGRFVDFRVAPDHTTLTPITCPNIARDTTQIRRGPLIHALNALRTVVGEEVIVQGGHVRTAGILQPGDGTTDCVLVQRPGAVGTFLRTVNDAGTSAGFSQGLQVSLGLRRFEGFTREPDGTFTPLTGVCNTDADGTITADVLFPEAMAVGWVVGYGYCNVQPTNAYTYHAFFCQDGVGCRILQDPEGQDLWLPAVTNDGLAYGSQARGEGIPSGKAYQIDLAVTPPAFTELPLPPPTTAGGTVLSCHPTAAGPQGWVCTAAERRANCPPPDNPTALCGVGAQWLALYDVPPEPTKQDKQRKEDRQKKARDPRTRADEKKDRR